MRKLLGCAGCLVLAGLMLGGCASSGFPLQTAQETTKVPLEKRIELSLEPGSFEVSEVEFHVDSSDIPVDILRRAKDEMPEGVIGDCEIEYQGGEKFYEVTASVRGKEQEVMFTPEGRVHRWEVEVDQADVPELVIGKARTAIPGGLIRKAEQILDGDQKLLEYHFKIDKAGIHYKVVVPLGGGDVIIFRETIGEIEVPLGSP